MVGKPVVHASEITYRKTAVHRAAMQGIQPQAITRSRGPKTTGPLGYFCEECNKVFPVRVDFMDHQLQVRLGRPPSIEPPWRVFSRKSRTTGVELKQLQEQQDL